MALKSRVIGGRTFEFGMMPADVATDVEVTIAGVATEALVKLIGSQGLSETEQAEAMAGAVGALAGALGRLGPGKTTALMNTLFRYTYVEGQDGEGRREVNMIIDFTGKTKDKWTTFFEALKVNLGDFFPAGLSLSPQGPAPR
jgi:hypothetical protein